MQAFEKGMPSALQAMKYPAGMIIQSEVGQA
jgi:hypothetical protein